MLLPEEVASRIEHTLLKPEATPEQIDQLCDEALANGFAGVCVNPIFVKRAAYRLSVASIDESTKRQPCVVSVVGFPLGASVTSVKVDEAKHAMDDGAMEIDMVIPIGLLMAGEQASVRKDIEALASVVHGHANRGLLKVILETAVLSDEQIILGCRCCAEGEADFVKTSTGMHAAGGATERHVEFLHRYAAPMKVKAAGGIKNASSAITMIEAGASRIGTSSGLTIMHELSAHTC